MKHTTTPSAKKLLIVDDEKPFANYWKTVLGSLGFNVVTSFGGEEALLEMNKVKFDLVLLDLKMPRIDGFGVLEKMPSTLNAATPVYVISSLDEVALEHAKSMGAKEAFLKYNLDPKELVKMVQKEVQ